MKILGIETSCDETAAAVVEDGIRILSSIVASQVKDHHPYGGVVPELASRKHAEAIGYVVEAALEKASLSPSDLDAVAVVQGPGLAGALMVGFNFAKAFAYALGLPLVAVDHLEGHINSLFLCNDPPGFPFVTLLASGGHTGIYIVSDYTEAECIGRTKDDAAGEAFDKVAKMMGLGYPGGGVISDLARKGDPGMIGFPRAYLDKNGFDFSFSGLKTAVKRYLETNPGSASMLPDIAAGFQEAVVDVLVYKLMHAVDVYECSRVAVVGGVAANPRLREKLLACVREKGISLHIPPPELCGDNAAMVASAGYRHITRPDFEPLPVDADVYSRSTRLG